MLFISCAMSVVLEELVPVMIMTLVNGAMTHVPGLEITN